MQLLYHYRKGRRCVKKDELYFFSVSGLTFEEASVILILDNYEYMYSNDKHSNQMHRKG